jgi:hypothetical protein
MPKKDKAIFTIVNNEKIFLPIWIEHYKNFFDSKDIFVFDHLTQDGSTNDLDVKVVKLNYNKIFNHSWLRKMVEKIQKTLLDHYKVVIFTEVDELLYDINMSLDKKIELFIESKDEYLTCTTFELFQQIEIEKNFEPSKHFILQRNYWFRDPGYDKTLITKIPLKYNFGFHTLLYQENNFSEGLYMLHIRRLDLNLRLLKHNFRFEHCSFDEKDSHGYHNKLDEYEKIKKWFVYDHIVKPDLTGWTQTKIERIPDLHKNIFLNLIK